MGEGHSEGRLIRASKHAVLAAVTVLFAAGGRARGSAEARKVALGETFCLEVGGSALVEAEALWIGFRAVAADSRCPKGETCIWEGDATVRFWVRRATEAKETRELHTSARGPAAVSFETWSIRLLALEPYPVSGRAIRQADYVAILEVTRGSPAEGEIR